MELTYKQRLFVSYYLGESGGNATDAARRAGYRECEVTGHRLLRKAKVRAAIDACLEGAALTADEVLARLSEMASGSLGSFVEIRPDGTWSLDLAKAKRLRKLGLIKKLKAKPDGTTEIELHDPQAALDKLAKYHGLYKERLDLTSNGDAIESRVIILPDNGRDPDHLRDGDEDKRGSPSSGPR